jgi:hypothetical protein
MKCALTHADGLKVHISGGDLEDLRERRCDQRKDTTEGIGRLGEDTDPQGKGGSGDRTQRLTVPKIDNFTKSAILLCPQLLLWGSMRRSLYWMS